jgi:hypothetical protein
MSNPPSPQALAFLGRRVERLVFVGILLILLCFVEAYLAAANTQLNQDRHADAVTALLNHLEPNSLHLADLYKTKSPPPSPLTSTSSSTAKRQKAINETRKKLGLPPALPPKPERPVPKPPTYADTLHGIINAVEMAYPELRSEFDKYDDPTRDPGLLIDALKKQKDILERAPTTVWGIQTPRLLQFQYAGMDYKFPFGLVSSALEIALAPLIIGWIGALMFTRQRELFMIKALDDYKLTFPHILNILPVNFLEIEGKFQAKETRKARIYRRKFNQGLYSIFRSFFVLLITLPMLFGFTYSLFQLLDIDKDLDLIFFGIGLFMAFIMLLQTIILVAQEWLALHKKEFYE